MKKKSMTMENAFGKEMRKFDVPTFENFLKIDNSGGTGIHPMRYTANLGDYCMQIGQIVSHANNTDSFAIAVACSSTNAICTYKEKIFYSSITVDKSKEGLSKLKEWYESKTVAAHEALKNHLLKTYFVDEKQQKNEMDNAR